MTSQERLLKFEAENDDLSLRTSHLDCQIAIRQLLDDLAAAREDAARSADSWRTVDLGPKGEWFMGRLKNGTEKPLRRLPDGSSYEYSDVTFTYYSWYWLTHWRPLTDDERAAIDSARAGSGK